VAKLDKGARMTIETLKGKRRNTDVADMLGVTEGTIRYHQRLRTEGAVDGRSKQRQLAADYAEPIRFYREQHQEAGISVTRSTTGWLRTTSIQGRSAQCIATGHVVQRHPEFELAYCLM